MEKDKNLIGEKITREDLLKFLSFYWSVVLKHDIKVYDRISIIYDNNNKAHLNWQFYYIDSKTNKVHFFNQNDINISIMMLSKSKGYNLEHYRIIGGVRLKENNPYSKKDKAVVEGIFVYYNGLIEEKTR